MKLLIFYDAKLDYIFIKTGTISSKVDFGVPAQWGFHKSSESGVLNNDYFIDGICDGTIIRLGEL